MEAYKSFINNVYKKLEEGENSIQKGDVLNGFDSLRIIEEEYLNDEQK